MLRQKDGEASLTNSPPPRTSSGSAMGEVHDIPLLPGMCTAPLKTVRCNLAHRLAQLQMNLDYLLILSRAPLDRPRLSVTTPSLARLPQPRSPFTLLGLDCPIRLQCLRTSRRDLQARRQTIPNWFGNSPRTCLIRTCLNTCTRSHSSHIGARGFIYCLIAGSMSSSLVTRMQTGFCTGPHSFCERFSPLAS